MIRQAILLCTGSFMLLNMTARSQSLDSTLKIYANRYEQEKVHIHFDKDTYLPGETIWLKAYLLSGCKPSKTSKNIYFDWTDAQGNLLLHAVAPIIDGMSSGSFQIPTQFTGGAIHIKAYTQWMLNFDNNFLYNKDIPVLTMSDGSQPDRIKPVATMRFYAEGGDLVNGLSSLVAFEVLDQNGKPVAVKGAIRNASNIVRDSFNTVYNGMGSFKLKPVAGESYTASWKDEFGELHITPLPLAKASGLVMHLDTYKNGEVHYKLERTEDAYSLKKLNILTTINQKVVYSSTIDLTSSTVSEAFIATASFPSGVMQVTVFDANMSPLVERVVFVNNHEHELSAHFKREMINLNKRARNEISIEIPDSIATSFSVSVTDGSLGYDSAGANIFSDLLLSGDIKGNISSAASYLSAPDNADDNINLLLLTHGWRRFKWEDVVAGKLPEIHYLRDAEFTVLKGDIHTPSGAFDAEDSIALLMISKDKKKHILNLPISSNGTFIQRGLYYYDSVQIVYRCNHIEKIGSGVEINLFSGLLPAISPAAAREPMYEWVKVPEVILDKELNGDILETNDYTRKTNGLSYTVSPKPDTVKGNAETAAHYLANNFSDLKFPSAIKEPGQSGGDGKYVSYSLSNPAHTVNLSLDGSMVTMDDLKTISMKEVLFIKFIQRTSAKELPTLSITSRQSLDQNAIINNKTGFGVVTGYTPTKEFYAPSYADKLIEDYQATDFRSTLYWNPSLTVDKNHRKVNLVFYNNDVTNKFRVVIEGMNKQGKMARIEELIK